jgi:anti-anti-sigma regulatory factor
MARTIFPPRTQRPSGELKKISDTDFTDYTAKILKHDSAQRAIVINLFQLQAFSSYATQQIGFF